MKRRLHHSRFRSSLLAALGFTAALSPVRAQYTNLHTFVNGSVDGYSPVGSLTLTGTTLYGATSYGGTYDLGVVYKLNTDGSGYTNLHNFAGGSSEGGFPSGTPTVSGTTLYGMTSVGGAYNNGVVYEINTDGSGYTNLHSFGGSGDAYDTYGSLTLDSDGTTLYGNAGAGGVVFKINTDGSNYTILHSFTGGSGDGLNPVGISPIVTGTTLYGMTLNGGASNWGVVFRINTDGSGYTNLHSFTGGSSNGANPDGPLTLIGTTLYGLTEGGGPYLGGVLFEINTDGSGYTNLHNFGAGAEGGFTSVSLTYSGTTLYGLTAGALFQIKPDGSGYTNLYSFTGGFSLQSTPTVSGTMAYGVSGSAVVAVQLAGIIRTPSPLVSGVVGTAYNQTLTATGGTAPYTWTVVSNSLPAGLSLVASSGSITGTPTVATTADFTVQVTDGNSLSSEKAFSLAIGQVSIVIPPALSNVVAMVDGIPVGIAGAPLDFSVTASNSGNASLTYLWDFGDGSTSTNVSPSHVFTNCGPQDVTVMISDGIVTTTTGLAFSVACAFSDLPKPASLQMKSNFAPGKLDTATFKAYVDMPTGFSVTNTAVSVEVGSVVVPFTLNAKGKAVNAFSTIKLSHKGKATSTVWQVSAQLKGDYDTAWQNYGLTNATVRALPITVPVLLLFDTAAPESFYIEKPLLYKAKRGKSGSAR